MNTRISLDFPLCSFLAPTEKLSADFSGGREMTEAAIAVQTDHGAAQEAIGQGFCEFMLEGKKHFFCERVLVEMHHLACSRTVNPRQARLRGRRSEVHGPG